MKPVLLIALAMLAGCAGTPRSGAIVSVYDFGPPAATPSDTTANSGRQMALEVRAAPWLDAPSITYRLAYDEPLKRRQYAESRWASPPAALLAQHLLQKTGLVNANGGAETSCVTRLSLQEFSQMFETPHISHAIVQGRVDVVDGKRRIVATQHLRVQAQAASGDASGGVSALVAASGEVAVQLRDWLDRLEAGGVLKSCGG